MRVDPREVSRRAHRQIDLGRVSVHITAEQVAELADALLAIRAIANRAMPALADHYVGDVMADLHAIAELTTTELL